MRTREGTCQCSNTRLFLSLLSLSLLAFVRLPNRVSTGGVGVCLPVTPGQLRTVMQFGKVATRRYILDLVAPMSPIQGFAALLSAFGWVGSSE